MNVRPALYYPYIHVRSEQWLKATLLYVPVVKRIVPSSYAPADTPAILKFTKIVGSQGELLQAVPSFSAAAMEAQESLLEKLRHHRVKIERKFGRESAPPRDQYWIHVAKFNDKLLGFLLKSRLAWPSAHPNSYGDRDWFATHPTLGSAIMTTLGLSIAHEQGYDIVTPSSKAHEMLLTTKANNIFDTLISDDQPEPQRSLWQASQDLGQLVITLSGINLNAIVPEDIPELQGSKHFARFQQLLRVKAKDIAVTGNVEDYKQKLQVQAEEIVGAWHDARNGLGIHLRELLFEPSLVLAGEALKATFKKTGAVELLIAGGVSVGILIVKGIGLKETHDRGDAYRYLTEVKQAQKKILRLTFPLGLEA
jgi:hypothetical protein